MIHWRIRDEIGAGWDENVKALGRKAEKESLVLT